MSDPHPIVKESSEKIRFHSKQIREARKALFKAIEAAVKDRIPLEQLYL